MFDAGRAVRTIGTTGFFFDRHADFPPAGSGGIHRSN